MKKLLLTFLILPVISIISVNNAMAGAPLPDGACCTGEDECSVLSENDCDLASGIWLGPTTACELGTCDTTETGDCCSVHLGTGCSDSECEDLVCGEDDFCCNDAWDLICLGLAVELCGELCMDAITPGACCSTTEECSVVNFVECESGGGISRAPGTDCEPDPCVIDGVGDCCSEHGTTGCEDSECQSTVCDIDPFCCFVEWDNICVEEAEDLCGDLCAVSGPVAVVPTMGQWGMVIASIILGFFAVIRLWRIRDSEI